MDTQELLLFSVRDASKKTSLKEKSQKAALSHALMTINNQYSQPRLRTRNVSEHDGDEEVDLIGKYTKLKYRIVTRMNRTSM